MNMDGQAIGFHDAVDGWVRRSLACGVRNFADLLRSLPGVYPTDARRAVERLRRELPADWQLPGTQSLAPTADGWPIEHPLEFDWRFTPETVRSLIDRCQRTDRDSVAFLGAPSLAREAHTRGWRACVSLIDRNPTLVKQIQAAIPTITATCLDLLCGDPVSIEDCEATVADPPWYPEYILAFMWAASRLTRLRGRVILSLPPKGTRPGLLGERDSIFEAAADFGLRLASLEPAVLAYRTPFFERNALAAAGVVDVPWDWRRGDLAEFVVTEKTRTIRPTPPIAENEWDNEAIDVVRFKCKRQSEPGFRDPTLLPAVDGNILPSVSRRDLRRIGADVWTCGNRIFKSKGPGVFRTIVSALGRGLNAYNEVTANMGRTLSSEEREMIERATNQALTIARIESMEIEHGYTDIPVSAFASQQATTNFEADD